MIVVGSGIPYDLQRVVDVVALRPLPGQAAEVGSAERIAARLGNDVELRPASIGLTEPARHSELHFLGVGRVVAVARHAAAIEGRADVHPVDLNRAFVAAATARGEEDHRRVDATVLRAVGLDARDCRQQIAVPTRCRQRREDFVAEHTLHARAVLHVHHGRLTRDRDRFLHATDAQIRVERECHTGRHLDSLALDSGEARQGVGDLVGSGCQVLDAVLAGAVTDGGSNLLDQGWTCCLDRRAGQHSSGRVSDHPGDRLGRRE